MSKVWNFIITLVSVTLLMKFAGIPTGLDWLFSFVGFSTNANGVMVFTGSSSTLWLTLVRILLTATASAIVVGYFTKSSFEWPILAGIATGTAILFISTFISIINYASSFDSWIAYIALTIYGLLGVGFLWGLIEWVFNRQ